MILIFWFSCHTIIITAVDNCRNILILLVGEFVGDDSDGNDVGNCHGEEAGHEKKNDEDQSDDIGVDAKVFSEAATYTADAAIFKGAVKLFIVRFDVRFWS